MMGSFGHTGSVHPHDEMTLKITTGALPWLVNSNEQCCLPAFIENLPKLCDVLLNLMGISVPDCAAAQIPKNEKSITKMLNFNIL
jgi:hypothetical protein